MTDGAPDGRADRHPVDGARDLGSGREERQGEPLPPDPPPGMGPPWVRGVLAVVLSQLVLAVFMAIALAAWSGFGSGSGSLDQSHEHVALIAMALGALPTVVLMLAAWLWLDGGTPEGLGYAERLPAALRQLGLGTAGGVGVMAAVVAVATALGGYRFAAEPIGDALASQVLWIPVLLIAAHFEEVLLRGYVLQNLGRRHPLVGLAVSASIFAVLHALNPGATDGPAGSALLTMVNIALSGIWLGAAFIRSGSLCWATGLHLGWNWAQGALFGLPVSGIEIPSLFRAANLQPGSLLTGTTFGPECSLVALAALLALAAHGTWRVVVEGRRVPVVAAWRRRLEPTVPTESIPPVVADRIGG